MTTTQLLEADSHVDTFAGTYADVDFHAAPQADTTAEPPEFADLTARDLMHRPDSPRHATIAPGVALSPSDSIQTCARTLVDRNLDALPVLDDVTRHILGAVSLRDIARAAADVPPPYHGVPRTGSAWHPERG
jgi:hypothetical protein